jgi:nucleotide-binding universal stress UspA family protein
MLLVNVIDKENDFAEAAQRLNRLREDLAAPGKNITVHVLQGRPSDEILSLSEKHDVSMIVMCSQGKSWRRQIRVGSTTFDVVRRAKYPVLVVRPGK